LVTFILDIDPAFGNWLAGFTDGEGCFDVHCQRTAGRITWIYRCKFDIRLRADDKLILEEIHQRLGIGYLYDTPATSTANPSVTFTVAKKSDCVILRDIFRVHPLRAKKAADFQVWSQALDLSLSHRRGESWDSLADLHVKLREGRKFTGEVKCLNG
jgi:hypothetical protein